MLRFVLPLAVLSVVLAATQPAVAQSNQFRDTRAHLGAGVGVFTYYGPIDLAQPESDINYVRESDPAVVLLGSFPIVGDKFYFRGMIGWTNFDPSSERALVDRFDPGLNEFLREPLFFFEPQIVYTLAPGSRSRILPYIYTGFGGLLADPFGSTEATNIPGSGIPGPERSVFAFPLGVGLDFAISPWFSFFIDASYRFNFNYVARNEINGVNPHDTSLVFGGIRVGIPTRRRRAVPVEEPVGPLPEPVPIPPYRPPLPDEPEPEPEVCILVDLNTVFFARNSAVLTAEARGLLDFNVEALRLNPICCVDIVGYRDGLGDSAYDLRIARQRAQVVLQYYLDHGVSPHRLRTRVADDPLPPCGKKDDACPGRVDSIPLTCEDFGF